MLLRQAGDADYLLCGVPTWGSTPETRWLPCSRDGDLRREPNSNPNPNPNPNPTGPGTAGDPLELGPPTALCNGWYIVETAGGALAEPQALFAGIEEEFWQSRPRVEERYGEYPTESPSRSIRLPRAGLWAPCRPDAAAAHTAGNLVVEPQGWAAYHADGNATGSGSSTRPHPGEAEDVEALVMPAAGLDYPLSMEKPGFTKVPYTRQQPSPEASPRRVYQAPDGFVVVDASIDAAHSPAGLSGVFQRGVVAVSPNLHTTPSSWSPGPPYMDESCGTEGLVAGYLWSNSVKFQYPGHNRSICQVAPHAMRLHLYVS